MSHSQSYPGASPESQSKIVHVHFDVNAQPVRQQLLAWRERIGPIMDVVPSRAQIERPFRGAIDWYEFGELLFCDTYTDELTLERTIARISQDNARAIAFHIVIGGDSETLLARPAKRQDTPVQARILAVNFAQHRH